jgi:chromosome segregation ATPase
MAADPKMWSEVEILNLIQREVSVGTTMQILSESIASGTLATGVQEIVTAANAQVNHLNSQAETNAREINRILGDCRVFVEQTQKENEKQKQELQLELDALQLRFRDLAALFDKAPEKIEGLDGKISEVDNKLKAVTDWCSSNRLDAVPVALTSLTALVNSAKRSR